MTALIAGIVIFFGIHSISVVALPLRDKLLQTSEIGWKGFYTLLSLAGFYLIVTGYADARLDPGYLYTSPVWMRYISAVLLLPVFVLFLATYFPGKISAATKHPQLVAVKLWALSHLLVNGTLADVLLFGSFLAWAVAVRISMKRRPVRSVPGLPESRVNDIIILVAGLGLYVAFALWLHPMWIGIPVI
jgi:uncharacterized membrane protein